MGISHIVDKSGNNQMITPKEALARTLEEIESGEIDPNRLIVLYTNDGEGHYFPGYRAANISCSQIISLLEIGKIMALEEMGYL